MLKDIKECGVFLKLREIDVMDIYNKKENYTKLRDEAKEYLPMLRMGSYDELKQAIADVESCMEVTK